MGTAGRGRGFGICLLTRLGVIAASVTIGSHGRNGRGYARLGSSGRQIKVESRSGGDKTGEHQQSDDLNVFGDEFHGSMGIRVSSGYGFSL